MNDTTTSQSGQFELLLAYWRRLQEEQGGVPKRSALNPVEIRELLPYVFLVERRAADELYVRLSGTALDAISPLPMTGENYLNLCPPETKEFVSQAATAVCETPCGHRFQREATFQNGRTHEITTLALPLMSGEGNVRYMVGVSLAKKELMPADIVAGAYVAVTMRRSEFVDIGYGLPNEDTLARLMV